MRTIKALKDLVPDPCNANSGTLRGEQLLDVSLSELGAGRSVVVDKNGIVIAGNKTLQMAIERGLDARVVRTDGSTLVAVRRADLDLASGTEARRLAYLDNRVSEVGLKWDPVQLERDLADGVQLGGMFDTDELDRLLAPIADETAPAVPLLKSKIDFDSSGQQDRWLRTIQTIAERPGGGFPAKLTAWVDEQIVWLESQS